MTILAALIPTDLSRIDLLRDGVPGEHWVASGGDATDAAALRRRITESTMWCARQCNGRRLAAVVDVHEAGCRWVHAPSTAPPVVAASLRHQGEEWASVAPVGGVQPMSTQQANGAGAHLVALTMPDAMTRLWLDGLDRLGTRVTSVVTLWHAAVAAWADATPGQVQAIILADDAKRLVWAWSDARNLLTGGQVRLADHRLADAAPAASPQDASRAMARLALDFASWATLLGRAPASIRLVGGAEMTGLHRALTDRFRSIPIDHVEQPDALVATLRRAGEQATSATPADAPTKCLSRLSQRPGRRLRWTYRLWGAALLVLGAGLAIAGVRAWTLASAWNDKTAEARAELLERVRADFPDEYLHQPGQNPVTWLRSTLATVNAGSASDETPPAPRPIYETTSTLFEVIADATGDPKLAKIRLSQSSGDNFIQLRGIGLTEAYPLIETLTDRGTGLTWEIGGNTGGSRTTNQTLRLNGTWQAPEAP